MSTYFISHRDEITSRITFFIMKLLARSLSTLRDNYFQVQSKYTLISSRKDDVSYNYY